MPKPDVETVGEASTSDTVPASKVEPTSRQAGSIGYPSWTASRTNGNAPIRSGSAPTIAVA